MRTAVGAFIAAGVFLAGVLVGLGSQRSGVAPAPVALTSTGGGGQPEGPAMAGPRGSDVKQVRRMVGYGELDDQGGHVTYEEDTAGGGGGGDDNSGPGGGGGDDSGPGSDDSGSGSDTSGSSGSGSSGSGSSGSGSSGPG